MCDLTELVWTKEDVSTPEDLLLEICKLYNVFPLDVRSVRRNDKTVLSIRRTFCTIAINEFPSCSFDEIGRVIRRDHSTVCYYIKSVMANPTKFQFYMDTKKKLKWLKN